VARSAAWAIVDVRFLLIFTAAVVPSVAHHPFQLSNGPVSPSPYGSAMRGDADAAVHRANADGRGCVELFQ
jgi:hypothetical protein